MDITHTVAHLTVAQKQVQPWPLQKGPMVTPPKPRHAPNSAASVVVALCFMGLFIGVIVFTSYSDRTARSKPREPAHNMPMVHLR